MKFDVDIVVHYQAGTRTLTELFDASAGEETVEVLPSGDLVYRVGDSVRDLISASALIRVHEDLLDNAVHCQFCVQRDLR